VGEQGSLTEILFYAMIFTSNWTLAGYAYMMFSLQFSFAASRSFSSAAKFSKSTIQHITP
jgi:hypothetical protein